MCRYLKIRLSLNVSGLSNNYYNQLRLPWEGTKYAKGRDTYIYIYIIFPNNRLLKGSTYILYLEHVCMYLIVSFTRIRCFLLCTIIFYNQSHFDLNVYWYITEISNNDTFLRCLCEKYHFLPTQKQLIVLVLLIIAVFVLCWVKNAFSIIGFLMVMSKKGYGLIW